MWNGYLEPGGNLLNRIYGAQECDARNDDSSKVVGSIKENRIICNYRKTILHKLQRETG
jgi:hypothetical protein